MKKLLHERLREASEGSLSGTCSSVIKIVGMSCEECDDCVHELLKRLADEIERYYIPRPRFEDGEPIDWHETDITWDNRMPFDFNAVTAGGRPLAYAGDEICAMAELNYDGFVKRLQPKVLDADGVEIKVGDTVWDIKKPDRKKHTVIEVIPDDNCVICEDKLTYTPEYLTHKEPDSLEKLRDDMKHVTADFDVTYGDMQAWVDRLSALIERGA